jgi:hypothetical protein
LYTLCTTAAPANKESRATLYALNSSGTAIALPLLADLFNVCDPIHKSPAGSTYTVHSQGRSLDAGVGMTKLLTGQSQAWPENGWAAREQLKAGNDLFSCP